MTKYNVANRTLYNNFSSVMEYIMPIALQEKVKSNVRLYFYKYNVYDLLEIEFIDDVIFVNEFTHNVNSGNVIKNDLEFYAGYFRAGGLEGKKFLFNTVIKTPVSYVDFIQMDKIPYPTHKEFLFLLDKKNEGYVTGEKVAYILVTSDRTCSVDKSLLSIINNAINIKDPKIFELAGCMASSIISGMLDNINADMIRQETELVDVTYKYIKSVNSLDFNSSNVFKIKSKLRTNKFERILNSTKKNNVIDGDLKGKGNDIIISKGEAKLSDLIKFGIDKFIDTLDNGRELFTVVIDIMMNNITAAQIYEGTLCLFVPVGTTIEDMKNIKDFLDTENIEFIVNG